MPVYFLDNNPREAARCLCDKHLGRILVDTVQILCAVCQHYDYEVPYNSFSGNDFIVVWAKTSLANFRWLNDYADEIGKEYVKRYKKSHATIDVLKELPTPPLANISLTEFPSIVPDKYKMEDTVESYRNLYIHEKSKNATWNKGTNPPNWYKEGLDESSKILYMEFFEEFNCRLRVYDHSREGIIIESDACGRWDKLTKLTSEEQSLIERLCINLKNR